MSTRTRSHFAFLAGAMLLAACNRTETKPPAAAAAPPVPPLEHGRYLVEQVAMCADCHTPLAKDGTPDMEKHLMGGLLVFAPAGDIPGWVGLAPPIAGLPHGWTKQAMINFMSTGKKPGGIEAAPPMPRYRLSPTDAAAVAEYLASLKPES